MNKNKKFLSAVLAAGLAFCIGMPMAFATDDNAEEQLVINDALVAESSAYEQLMVAGDTSEMYDIASDLKGSDANALDSLTADEIDALLSRVDELDPEGDDPDTDRLADMLISLPGFVSGAEEGGEEAEEFVTKIEDDFVFSSNYEIKNAVTIKNEDTGGEANWSFKNGTLTINATVTIPKGQRLDILVRNDDSDKVGKIVAGNNLGSAPMFIVEEGAWLKIAKTNNNDGQNYGSIEISGGTIQVNKGGQLHMEDIKTVSGTAKWTFAEGANAYIFGDVPVSGNLSVSGSSPDSRTTIERKYTTGAMFNLESGADLSLANVVIDGGNKEANSAVIVAKGPAKATDKVTDVSLTNTTIQNSTSVATSGSAALTFNGWCNFDLDVNGCTFDNCNSVSGGAIYFVGYAQGSADISNTKFLNCTTKEGGAIRTNGNGGVLANLDQCVFKNNVGTNMPTSEDKNGGSHGGAIYWNACGTAPNGATAKMMITDCQFIENKANMYAGAVFNESFMEIGTKFNSDFTSGESTPGNIRGTLIKGNSATYGGGVQVPTYGGGAEPHNGVGAELTLGKGVFIIGNKATYGGGLAMNVGKGTIGNTAEDAAKVKFSITCDGAVIEGNTATEMGGGVYLERMKGFDLYPSTVNLNSGTISENKAPKGGAICVYNANGTPSTKTNKVNIGSANGDLLIENNEATGDSGLGGAVYISYGDVSMSNGHVANNAASNGGAVCVEAGDFSMSGGTMSSNTASANGGSVYVSGGSVAMSGGSIENSVASVNGGAVYVTGGSFSMSDGAMCGNSASGNGGAAYVSGAGNVKGDFTMKGGIIGGQDAGNSALNGGGVYVSGGDFNMISGVMSHNMAIEKTAGNAEAGSEGYGGGAYAADGNIYIGVEGCSGAGDKHSIDEYADLPHPVVTANEAVFGGGLAVKGGDVHVYCGEMAANESDNKGTGMNVFMTDDESDFFHYLESAEIGEETDHGMVSVGGTLTIVHGSDNQFVIKITYFSNEIKDEDGVEITWTGTVPDGYYLNLPYCPSDWQEVQDQSGLTFVGWAKSKEGTVPSAIRDKDDYYSIGDPVMMEDLVKDDSTSDGDIYFYAVWAPKTNAIDYAVCLDGTSIMSSDDAGADFDLNGAPTSYQFAMTSGSVGLATPSMRGYTFDGWRMYASDERISNWGMDADKYEPEAISDLADMPAGLIVDGSLQTLQNFGDIVLVAMFEPNVLTIEKAVEGGFDEGQTFLFKIEGLSGAAENVDMTVAIDSGDFGSGSSASAVVRLLPTGSYKVTELEDWSWRHESAEGTSASYQVDLGGSAGIAKSVSFANESFNEYWLSDEAFRNNVFAGKSN